MRVSTKLALAFVLVAALSVECKKHNEKRSYYEALELNGVAGFEADPPPPDEAARMARYIVHNADWTALATISSMPSIQSFPFANIYSVSDGIVSNSSGVPYLFMTPIEMSGLDLARDSRASLTMTLAQGDYCKKQNLDPEDPRCAHVILTGKVRKIKKNSPEATFAEEALFTRHPIMKTWPQDHGFYFAKLKIDQVCLMDYFGGPKHVKVKDYFNAGPGY